MNQPEPQSINFSTLLSDIEKGIVKVPQFQREFVWTKEKSAKLLDSILKGYPIGTFILWKTKEMLRSVRNIGNAVLPPTPSGDFVQYVLDGQQRLTSLYASIKGLSVNRNGKVDDFKKIYVDLTAKDSEEIVVLNISDKNPKSYIQVTDLFEADLQYLVSFPKKFHLKLSNYKKRIESYSFSVILVKEAPIDVATEIFTRINVMGKPLSVFQIMVAKTFDSKRNFDLAEKYDQLKSELIDVDYETIPESVILQTISCILKDECSKRVILKLKKNAFIDVWPEVINAVKYSVDYFRNKFRIPVGKLLPYNSLLVPFAYFFYHYKKKPDAKRAKLLQDFFWRISLTGKYSSALEARLAQDIDKIKDILKGMLPKYDEPVDVSVKFLADNGGFSTGRSFIKAILCLYAARGPLSFDDNSPVRISNDWLKRANSKNYHHFFPKAYLKGKKEEFYINHIFNITYVDDFLNKRVIKAQAPSRYMRKFKDENKKLHSTIKTHYIDLEKDGIWEDNYEKFYRNRAKRVSQALKRRMIKQDVDSMGRTTNYDDYEQEVS